MKQGVELHEKKEEKKITTTFKCIMSFWWSNIHFMGYNYWLQVLHSDYYWLLA